MRQIIRYGIVGVLNNSLGYLIYLAVTFMGLSPKLTITLFYPLGAYTAYLGHSKYSFSSQRNYLTALRYAFVYLIGYLVNFLLLYIFSDKLMYPHQIVQAAAIFVVAGILFLMLKFFVFPLPILQQPNKS